jgi:hypothetical protein
MQVEFMVEKRMRFTLSGELRLAPHGLGLNGSSASVRVTGEDGTIIGVEMNDTHQPDQTGVVDFMGAHRMSFDLGPGQYLLEAMSEGRGSDGLTRCADYDFTLTAVEGVLIPEPSAFGLLSVGIGMCWRSRRRHQPRSSRRRK